MLRVIEQTGEPDFYHEQILSTCATAPLEEWGNYDTEQLFDSVKIFAQRGDTRARRLMYDRFVVNYKENPRFRGEVYIGVEQLIELDGIDAFLVVADRVGALIAAGQPLVDVSYILELTAREYGEPETLDALRHGASTNLNLETYVKATEGFHLEPAGIVAKRRETPAYRYAEIREMLMRNPYGPRELSLRAWGKQASQEDIAQAAADLLQETDEKRLRSLLYIFCYRRFPLDHSRLFELVDYADRAISVRALMALSQIGDCTVRDFAFKLIRESRRLGDVVKLLINNYQDGDDAIIESLAASQMDSEEYHSLGFDVPTFYQAHPNPQVEARLLVKLYEMGPCSQCREKFVDRLMQLGPLPEWMVQECLADTNHDLAEKVRGYLATAN
ncbi:MAG: hypothetical protein WCF84_25345 [Anaerolineae bacterium]